jgi:tetratricopeptide (TPR) repeat protein
VRLDSGLAEAHATLALLLVGARRPDEAVAAAERAVDLDPSNWRHLFRLANASWGGARLEALARVRSLYPEFAFAHFQVAMVHVARNRLEVAEGVLREGISAQERSGGGERFPAQGLHWLLGLVLLAQARAGDARAVFDDGLRALDSHRLYGREYLVHTQLGKGMALLRLDEVDEAAGAFAHALAADPALAPSRLGMAACERARGESSRVDAELRLAEAAVPVLARSRPVEAATVRAQIAVARGRLDEAAALLGSMLDTAPPGHAAWTMPVDPFLRQLRSHQGFARVLERLATRAD